MDTANAGQQIGEENLYYQCLRDKRQVIPSVDCLIEMADLLGVSLDTLVYGENADLLSVHTLTQEQKKIVTAIVQAFEDTSLNAKNTDQRLRLVAEVVRLLAK